MVDDGNGARGWRGVFKKHRNHPIAFAGFAKNVDRFGGYFDDLLDEFGMAGEVIEATSMICGVQSGQLKAAAR